MISLSGNSSRKWCPFVKDPLNECMCSDMNSQKVEAAMYYCGGNYEECEIYIRRNGTRREELTSLRRTAAEETA